jgi:transcriptional regulator with XRE-family HTH domain
MQNKYIKLTNMKSVRMGKNITTLRNRNGLSIKQLAEKAKIEEFFLTRLEEGYESEFDASILERLANVLVGMRGKPTPEDLVNVFLDVPPEEPTLMI